MYSRQQTSEKAAAERHVWCECWKKMHDAQTLKRTSKAMNYSGLKIIPNWIEAIANWSKYCVDKLKMFHFLVKAALRGGGGGGGGGLLRAGEVFLSKFFSKVFFHQK